MQNTPKRIWILAAGFATLISLTPRSVGAEAAQTQGKTIPQVTTTTQTVKIQAQTQMREEENDYFPPYIALALKAGTLGAGAELTLGVMEDALNIRVGGNYLPLKFSGKIKDVDYEVEINWGSVPMMLDWHPFDNNFRITGGVMYNRNRAHLDARLNDSQKIGDHEYTPEEIGTLTGSVDFRQFAPYVGLGFGNAVGGPDTSWNFVFDVGVMFQGVPGISLSADGAMSGDPTFQADLAREEDDIQNEADKFQFYPVVAAGVSYQF
ncbi:MAG: hypothetical protein KKG09_01260 [Verrucomicrobia bacterium]|nr:hypothetical protein [Verrucomicrobiota bacterium]MBU4246773.1 hypothetical protein [Verrucomicrobiota bacterium]MBU4290561.1 hypothetical protein [Verrucomicrobiota bacterium]MBU4496621.1 hypothetical protein [Verrucomicrobiota bacterium]MCG2681682.1 hypothetical protein [Kiritimatiellia bacterium]